MFSNFAWSEILVIACVAIIVIGPKDLPAMLRQFGKFVGTMKRMAGDFQRQFNDAIKDTELDDIKNMTSSKGFGPLEDARKSMENLQQSIGESLDAEPEIEAPAAATKPVEKSPARTKATKSAKKPVARKTAASKTKTAAKPAAKKPAAKKPAKSAKISS